MQNTSTIQKSSFSFTSSKRAQDLLACSILLMFVLLNILSVRNINETIDEPFHYKYGMNILNGDSTRFDDSKMPVSAWNALPSKLSEYLPEGLVRKALSTSLVARLMTTIFSMVTGFAVFVWARKLYGFIPALFSLGLYVLDPNIIAHSQLVTTDIYAMGMILFSSYWLWKFAESRRWQDGLIFSAMIGLSQLTKYTAIALYPLSAVALLAHDGSFLKHAFQTEGWRRIWREITRYLKYGLVVIVVSLLILNIGFLFNDTFKPFDQYRFRSEQFQALQQKLSFVVPTPYPYLEGLDWVVQRERTGEGYGHIYLLGTLRKGGFAGYYLIATLFKEPVATQLLMLAALVTYFLNKQKRQAFWRNEIFLLLPVLFFTIYFNFFYNAQIGIRYYLVVFPLMFIFTGSLFSGWNRFHVWQKSLSVGLMVYLFVSVLSYYPYYLTYFNELIWDKTQTFKILADSNLDWEQSKLEAERYMDEHPAVHFPPERPKSGKFIVGTNQLVGILTDPHKLTWLRDNFKPVQMIGNYYYIYEISQDDITHLCETTSYCQ